MLMLEQRPHGSEAGDGPGAAGHALVPGTCTRQAARATQAGPS